MLNNVDSFLFDCKVKDVQIGFKSKVWKIVYWYLELIKHLDIVVRNSKYESFSSCKVFRGHKCIGCRSWTATFSPVVCIFYCVSLRKRTVFFVAWIITWVWQSLFIFLSVEFKKWWFGLFFRKAVHCFHFGGDVLVLIIGNYFRDEIPVLRR